MKKPQFCKCLFMCKTLNIWIVSFLKDLRNKKEIEIKYPWVKFCCALKALCMAILKPSITTESTGSACKTGVFGFFTRETKKLLGSLS